MKKVILITLIVSNLVLYSQTKEVNFCTFTWQNLPTYLDANIAYDLYSFTNRDGDCDYKFTSQEISTDWLPDGITVYINTPVKYTDHFSLENILDNPSEQYSLYWEMRFNGLLPSYGCWVMQLQTTIDVKYNGAIFNTISNYSICQNTILDLNDYVTYSGSTISFSANNIPLQDGILDLTQFNDEQIVIKFTNVNQHNIEKILTQTLTIILIPIETNITEVLTPSICAKSGDEVNWYSLIHSIPETTYNTEDVICTYHWSDNHNIQGYHTTLNQLNNDIEYLILTNIIYLHNTETGTHCQKIEKDTILLYNTNTSPIEVKEDETKVLTRLENMGDGIYKKFYDVIVCNGNNLTLTIPQNPNYTYKWYDDYNMTNELITSNIYEQNQITQDKTLFVKTFNNGCISDNHEASITINVKHPIYPNVITNKDSICKGEILEFTPLIQDSLFNNNEYKGKYFKKWYNYQNNIIGEHDTLQIQNYVTEQNYKLGITANYTGINYIGNLTNINYSKTCVWPVQTLPIVDVDNFTPELEFLDTIACKSQQTIIITSLNPTFGNFDFNLPNYSIYEQSGNWYLNNFSHLAEELTITYTATNINNCTKEIIKTINFLELPSTPDLENEVNGRHYFCKLDSNKIIRILNPGLYTYTWYKQILGTYEYCSTGDSLIVETTTDINYRVNVTAGECTSFDNAIFVTIDPSPLITLELDKNIYCKNDNILFYINDTAFHNPSQGLITDYFSIFKNDTLLYKDSLTKVDYYDLTWKFDTINILNYNQEQNFKIICERQYVNSLQPYKIEICPSNEIKIIPQIEEVPNPQIIKDSVYCKYEQVILALDSNNYSSINWYNVDTTLINSGQSPIIPINNINDIILNVQAYSQNNCKSNLIKDTIKFIQIDPNSIPLTNKNSIYCNYDSIQITNINNNEYDSLKWYNSNYDVIGTNSTITFSPRDTSYILRIKGITSEGCYSITKTDTVNIDKTTAEFHASNPNEQIGLPVHFIYDGNNGNEFYWYFSDSTISYEQNAYHYFNLPGFYNVTLITTSINGCTDTTTVENAVYIIDVSVSELEENIIKIYPNPFNDYIQIVSDNNINIKIYDNLGKLRLSKENIKNDKIDVSFLNRGIYFITIQTANKIYTKKLIKN